MYFILSFQTQTALQFRKTQISTDVQPSLEQHVAAFKGQNPVRNHASL